MKTVQNVRCAHPVSQKIVYKNVMKSKFNPTQKKNQLSTLKNKKVGKLVQRARCAVVKCTLCSGIRSDLSTQFKQAREKKLLLRVSLKLLKN